MNESSLLKGLAMEASNVTTQTLEDVFDNSTCPHCNGEPKEAAVVGVGRCWLRCRQCGMDYFESFMEVNNE